MTNSMPAVPATCELVASGEKEAAFYIELPGDNVFPEGITAAGNGDVYVGGNRSSKSTVFLHAILLPMLRNVDNLCCSHTIKYNVCKSYYRTLHKELNYSRWVSGSEILRLLFTVPITQAASDTIDI